jgi:hypothetical protein
VSQSQFCAPIDSRGRGRRISQWPVATAAEVDPAEIERIRWLMIVMSQARATPGSLAIAALAHRGYAIDTGTGPFRKPPLVVALDTPGFVHRGHLLPSSRRPWKEIERVALDVDPAAWPERRWCSAHETCGSAPRSRRRGMSWSEAARRGRGQGTRRSPPGDFPAHHSPRVPDRDDRLHVPSRSQGPPRPGGQETRD